MSATSLPYVIESPARVGVLGSAQRRSFFVKLA